MPPRLAPASTSPHGLLQVFCPFTPTMASPTRVSPWFVLSASVTPVQVPSFLLSPLLLLELCFDERFGLSPDLTAVPDDSGELCRMLFHEIDAFAANSFEYDAGRHAERFGYV